MKPKHSDFKKCDKCWGEGGWEENRLHPWTGHYQVTVKCPSCVNGYIPVEVRTELDVPGNLDWHIVHHDEGFVYFYNADGDYKQIDFPNPIGTEIELECNECGGKEIGRECLYCQYYRSGWTHTMCYECDHKADRCLACNGNPKLTVRLDSVTVEGKTLIERWVVV